ncbi:MAG: hypothetical protein IIV61_06490 [Oscillospiraceae bacterium]|nr:hypothetical protein [Oscillospiraceae bacterium]
MKKAVAVVLLVAIVLGLCACTLAEKMILGTWKTQNKVLGLETEVSYTFKEDGTGVRSGVLDMDFTYTMDGDRLTITTSVLGVDVDEEYTFQISGKELVLTRESETITLVRVD